MADAQRGRRPGRKYALTDEHVTEVELAMRSGGYQKDAWAYAGIGRSTAQRYLATAEDTDPEPEDFETYEDLWRELDHVRRCRALRDALKKGEVASKIAALGRIKQAGQNGTWQADAWYLERRYPHEFGRRLQEVVGAGDGPVQLSVNRSTIEELLANADATAAAQDAALAESTKGTA